MDAPTSRFAARGPDDLQELVRHHPLAWVVSRVGGEAQATPLPLLLHVDAEGRPTAFEGHFPRSHPQALALRANPEALILLMGAQGYVSPSWMTDRTQAPTWNYESAQCRVRIRFEDDPQTLARHLDALVEHHEAGRPGAWSLAEMGPRYATLAARIVAFRAEPVAIVERYKLGQDERDDVFADILVGLTRAGRFELVDRMRRFNPGRGPAATELDPAPGAGSSAHT